jgi:hypothetical protein
VRPTISATTEPKARKNPTNRRTGRRVVVETDSSADCRGVLFKERLLLRDGKPKHKHRRQMSF